MYKRLRVIELYFCHILIKLDFSRQILEKIIKYHISWTPVSGNRGFPRRQTDKHGEVNSCFS